MTLNASADKNLILKKEFDAYRFKNHGNFHSMAKDWNSNISNVEIITKEDVINKSKTLPDGISSDFDYYYFKGLANAYNKEDLADDMLLTGAFKKDLKARGNIRPCLYQHDPYGHLPLGLNVLTEKPDGLYVETFLIKGIGFNDDLYKLIKTGVIHSYSVGFVPMKDDLQRENATGDYVRRIEEGKLYEVSIVLFPCNEDSIITEIKNYNMKNNNVVGDSEMDENQMQSLITKSVNDSITNVVKEILPNAIKDTLLVIKKEADEAEKKRKEEAEKERKRKEEADAKAKAAKKRKEEAEEEMKEAEEDEKAAPDETQAARAKKRKERAKKRKEEAEEEMKEAEKTGDGDKKPESNTSKSENYSEIINNYFKNNK